jgi:diguanylate cyclase (GGDEF)-like protein/PAS domain S-box-containing protein
MRVAWLILLIALAATILAWSLDHQAVENTASARFNARSLDVVHAVAMRMDTYEQVLRGTVGLFRASEHVTFVEWRDYVDSLDIQGHYPGILGIGYAPYVPRAMLPPLLDDLAAQGEPLSLTPPGARETYAPVIYIAPLDARNQRALGVDMLAESLRREAIEKARDTGQATLSAPVVLTQETGPQVQPGVIMYLPVYRNDPQAQAERRAGFSGVVFAPFRVNELMEGTLGATPGDLQLDLFDGSHADPARLIYAGRHPSGANGTCIHESLQTITVATRDWTIRVCGTSRFTAPADLATEHIILATGAIISLLLFGITWSLATTRARALAIAQRMTHELSEERARLSEIAASLGEGLYVQDNDGVITYSNPAAAHLLAWEPGTLVGRNSIELIAPEARASGIGTTRHAVEREASGRNRYLPEETLFQRRDGTRLTVAVISTAIVRDGSPVGSVVAFHDVSEQRRAAVALREALQFSALFQYSRDAFFLMDLEGRIIDANRVALDSLGYRREELLGSGAGKFVRWATVPQPGQTLAAFFDTLTAAAAVRGEAEYLRHDGSSFFVEAAFSPLTHEGNKLILISARDITERKEAERRIQRALDDLERSRREIEETNRRLAESNRELQRMTRRDGLTNIANRRSFDEYLALEWNRAARDRRPLSLLMIDVDHFKAYNDRYGHPAGDDCLRRVAEALERQLGRSIDIVARYGGEEFAVVLPETPRVGAVNIGERLRHAVEELDLPHAESPTAGHVTISVGAATMIPHPGDSAEVIVSASDAALYSAKQNGRNRVCTAGSPDD